MTMKALVDCTKACGAQLDLFWKGHTNITLPTSRSPLRPHRIEMAFLDGLTFNILRAVCTRANGKLTDTSDKLDVFMKFGVDLQLTWESTELCLQVVDTIDNQFEIPMHDHRPDPLPAGSSPVPQLEIGRLGKPYDSSCWYTWFTLTCSEVCA